MTLSVLVLFHYDGGSVRAYIPKMGLIGIGATETEARDEVFRALRAYMETVDGPTQHREYHPDAWEFGQWYNVRIDTCDIS